MAYTYKHGDRPVDRVTVQRAVGRGGFGEVYYALTDSGKQVALKYLRENPEIELRGIGQVMNLKSPHLITIYDVVRSDHGDPFVLMEYVSGPSLRDLLTAEPNGLGPQKAAFFLKGIGAGLAYLHERGIVHRDLKPGNIFYDDGYVKIGDYGLSKHISMSAHSGNTISVGTVHYMAPEIGSGSYSKAIDIYALGVILFELLTGRLPYTGASMGEVLMRHLNDRPDLVGVPEPFRSVIARALAKNPAERYQNVNEMVEAVTAVGEIDEQIRSFNPATLTQVPRGSAEQQTQTAGGRRAAPPPPPLDVRAGEFPPIPPIPDVPGAGRRPRKLQEKLRQQWQRARSLGQRLGKGDRAPAAAAPADVADPPRKWWPQFLAVLLPTVGVGVGLGLLADAGNDEVGVIAMILLIMGGLFGPLVMHFQILSHVPTTNWVLTRFIYATGAVVFMLPGILLAADEVDDEFAALAVPMGAIFLLFDWEQRIKAGRRGVVDSAMAFPAAIAGLAIGAVATEGEHIFVAAGACAALALLVPAMAACWPLSREELAAAGKPDEQAMLAAAARYDRGDAARYAGAPGGASPAGAAGAEDASAAPASAPPGAAEGDSRDRERGGAPSLAQPSFVGRAASAGLSFVGKALILLGLLWAFGYGAELNFADLVDDGGAQVRVGFNGVYVAQDGVARADVPVPKWAVIVPFVLGLVLLMSARRHDGGWHFVRGLAGCGFAAAAAIHALGPAAAHVRVFFGDDWDALRTMDGAPLTRMLAFAVAALLLIFWPKRNPRRIVI